MDFNRRHTDPLAQDITAPFFDDGQALFLPHGGHFNEVEMDEDLDEDNEITYEDYFNHLAGFDENNY